MRPSHPENRKLTPLQSRLNEIIFGWETPAGKLFDVVLLIIILASIIFVMLESVDSYNDRFSTFFKRGSHSFAFMDFSL